MRFDIAEVAHRIKSNSFEEYLHGRLPKLYKLLASNYFLQRIQIFRKTKSNLNLLAWLYWLVTGHHLSKKGFSMSNYGVWLANRPNDITYNFCLSASYKNGLEGILHDITERTTFVDVGANIGVFSLVASQNPNIDGIHSFEPDLESFEFFELNILRNHTNRIFSHNHAIGKNVGEVRLTKNQGHSGASRIDSELHKTTGPSSTITMMNHIYLNSVLDPRADNYFVKIDVEGYELEVLETLQNADFFPFIQRFFIEFDEEFGKVQQVQAFLLRYKFIEMRRWGTNSHWDSLWVKQIAKEK